MYYFAINKVSGYCHFCLLKICVVLPILSCKIFELLAVIRVIASLLTRHLVQLNKLIHTFVLQITILTIPGSKIVAFALSLITSHPMLRNLRTTAYSKAHDLVNMSVNFRAIPMRHSEDIRV